MKKILTHLTGIVFLITILIAGGCGSATENDSQTFTDPTVPKVPTVTTDQTVPDEVDTVTIYLVKAFEENGKKHLKMFDSNDPNIVVVDTLLVTDVKPGTKVIWTFLEGSGIEKLKKIGPEKTDAIIIRDAKKILFKKDFQLKIPNSAKPGQEKYDIVFEDEDGNTVPIDPYLRIR